MTSSHSAGGNRHADTRIWPFFAVVFGSTWLLELPVILAQRGILGGPVERFMPLVVLGYFGPTITALLLARFDRGGGGLRALFRPLRIWRVGWAYYLVALSLPGAILVMGIAVYTLLGGTEAVRWFYPPASATKIAAMLVVPFTEQIAWRGFAYPRLEERYGVLCGSLVLGVSWGLFHVQKHVFLGDGMPLGLAVVTVALMTAGTVVFTWIYRRTRGSLLLVVVANMGIYLNNSSDALPASMTPLVIHAVGYGAVALGLILVDRSAWTESSALAYRTV